MLATGLLGLAPGCAAVPAPTLSEPPEQALAGCDLRVRLAFDDAADLDLYVTGPRQETVYFANTPSAIGGELEHDLRCDSPAGARVETIRFPAAPPGRYRVGVDFAERCQLPARPVAFTVTVEGAGIRAVRSGEIELGTFQLRFFEFEIACVGE
ncbi:MAG: hypothetical protein ACE5FL_10600 [Myxococcota bacterium]